MYQYAKKEQIPIQRQVCQLGKGKDFMESGNNNYVIKMNFAGSGNYTWNKAKNPDGLSRTAFEAIDESELLKEPFYGDTLLEEHTGSPHTLTETEKFDAMYGNRVSGYSEMYRKEKSLPGEQLNREVVYSISGPQAYRGAFDQGDNSIQKNVDSALKVITSEIDAFQQQHDMQSPQINVPKFLIIIKGHSRGAVAAGFTALALRHAYSKNPRVQISVTLYDPVPGPKHKGRYNRLDLKGNCEASDDLPEMTALEPGDESTLVYSICDQHYLTDLFGGFTPQEVMGADRLIFTQHNHTSGLDQQNLSGEHKQGFQTPGGKKELLGANINALGRGTYMADPSGKLSYLLKADWQSTLRPYSGYTIFHHGRNKVMTNAITRNSKYKRKPIGLFNIIGWTKSKLGSF